MIKKRSKESYYGNTPEARRMQRANLIGGGEYRRRKIQGARYDCWWEIIPLENRQEIFEAFENKRIISTYQKKDYFSEKEKAKYDVKDVPKEELKGKDFLDNWWARVSLEDKKFLYKNKMSAFTKESRSEIFKDMEKCLKEKLEKGI